jgi:hypothetical protein
LDRPRLHLPILALRQDEGAEKDVQNTIMSSVPHMCWPQQQYLAMRISSKDSICVSTQGAHPYDTRLTISVVDQHASQFRMRPEECQLRLSGRGICAAGQ